MGSFSGRSRTVVKLSNNKKQNENASITNLFESKSGGNKIMIMTGKNQESNNNLLDTKKKTYSFGEKTSNVSDSNMSDFSNNQDN